MFFFQTLMIMIISWDGFETCSDKIVSNIGMFQKENIHINNNNNNNDTRLSVTIISNNSICRVTSQRMLSVDGLCSTANVKNILASSDNITITDQRTRCIRKHIGRFTSTSRGCHPSYLYFSSQRYENTTFFSRFFKFSIITD